MYDIALSVAACLRAGTKVDVAWAVETRGFSSWDRSEGLALTPGGGRVGALMAGSLDDQVAELVRTGTTGRLVDLHVGDVDALVAGLSCGGEARCLIVPATDLPNGLWARLEAREAVCLVTRLDGDEVLDTTMFTSATIADAGEDAVRLFQRGSSDTAVFSDIVVTALWPVPRLVVVGAGAIAEAIAAAAKLLGWNARLDADGSATTGLAELAAVDSVVVISHDLDVSGSALVAALSGSAGYIGALGARHTQEARARWLAEKAVTDLRRVYGPAGLDVGARTPPEIAVSVLAEILAVKSRRTPVSLRERNGPIHSTAVTAD